VEFSRRFLAVTSGPDSPAAEQYRRAFKLEEWSEAWAPRVERVGDVSRVVTTFDHWSYTTFPNNPVLSGHESYWAAHDWLLAALAALPPAAWFMWRARRREASDAAQSPSDTEASTAEGGAGGDRTVSGG
jgi:hypothetical protein